MLDGATALAVPVRFGQSLLVEQTAQPGQLLWQSLEPDGTQWFEAAFELPQLRILRCSDAQTAQTLVQILRACQCQNPDFLSANTAFEVSTQTDFPREWGLGTSSTLLAALARWVGVDPYPLLFETLGGSGYDLACAYAPGPILYRLEGKSPVVRGLENEPPFTENLFFVFLGKKQNSREGIARYRERGMKRPDIMERISNLSLQFWSCQTLPEWDALVREHERLVGDTLGLPLVKDRYFGDYWGAVKSLGAWGGDFVLASSEWPEAETRAYFAQKGLEVVLPWKEMVYTVRHPSSGKVDEG